MRCPRRTEAQSYAVLLAAAFERRGVKLWAVVDEHLARQALAGPVGSDTQSAQVGCLVLGRVRDTQTGDRR